LPRDNIKKGGKGAELSIGSGAKTASSASPVKRKRRQRPQTYQESTYPEKKRGGGKKRPAVSWGENEKFT